VKPRKKNTAHGIPKGKPSDFKNSRVNKDAVEIKDVVNPYRTAFRYTIEV
jgi:uncharacterized metal-binding protein